MALLPPNSPYGLPVSPRATRPMVTPLDTSLSNSASQNSSPFSATEKQSPEVFIDTRVRRRSSLIFANATIPLSPASSVSNEFSEKPFEGLAPRKRNGLARLFCCFGREERARRRAVRFVEYEKVGEKCHWTEL